MKTVFYFLFLVSCTLHAQTYRDTLVSKIVYNFPIEQADYDQLKIDIQQLEQLDKKKNPELLYGKLEYFYSSGDYAYFKAVLKELTLHFGYNVSYLSGEENYYEAIISGDLSSWFKKMYLKNHVKWLEHNLDKLVDIQMLNSLVLRDQYPHKALGEVLAHGNLSKEQKKYVKELDDEYMAENGRILLDIASRIGTLPKGNSFALIQNGYDLVEWHNLIQNYPNFFPLIFPFYKTAYLKNEISSIKFRNIDSYQFFSKNKQVFGLLTVDDLPENLKEDFKLDYIELEDSAQTKHYREELNWQ